MKANVLRFFLGCLVIVTIGGCLVSIPFHKTPQVKNNDPQVTFLGNTTIAVTDIDSKETVMIDGFLSRPNLPKLAFKKLIPDYSLVVETLDKAGIKSIDTVIPLHSHFDHVLDAPYIASKYKSQLIGSRTTEVIAREMAEDTDKVIFGNYQFINANKYLNPNKPIKTKNGAFEINLEVAQHTDNGNLARLFAPNGNLESVPFDFSFKKGARAKKFVEGVSYNVLIKHKEKTYYILGGVPEGFTAESSLLKQADVIFAAIPIFSKYDCFTKKCEEFQDHFWNVVSNKNKTIVPVHWDNFLRPIKYDLKPNIALVNKIKSFKKDAFYKQADVKWLPAFGKL